VHEQIRATWFSVDRPAALQAQSQSA